MRNVREEKESFLEKKTRERDQRKRDREKREEGKRFFLSSKTHDVCYRLDLRFETAMCRFQFY